jgi:uncharacterized membrane protein YfhO
MEKDDIKYILLIFGLSCVLFSEVILNPDKMIFSSYFSDIVSQFYPYKLLIINTVDYYSNLPMWNPHILMGHPFVGNPISSMFYPQNFLYMFFNTDFLFGILLMIDVLLAGIFTYFFMRKIKASGFASFISACAFIFSGIFIARIYGGTPPNLDIISLFPLSLLVLEYAIEKRSLFFGIVAGIPLGLQVLAGNPEYTFYAWVGTSLYILFRLIAQKDTKIISIAIIAFLVGISLSAVQILPSIELSVNSYRANGSDFGFSTSYSLPPTQLLTLFMPEFYGTPLDESYWGERNFWELNAYIGLLPLILASIGLIFKRNKYSITFLLIAIISILIAFGRYFPLFPLLLKIIPIFSMFRTPSAILFLSVFSISVLSGFGYDAISGRLSKDKKRAISMASKFLLILVVFSILSIVVLYLKKDYIFSIAKSALIEKYTTFTSEIHQLEHGIDYYEQNIPLAYGHILADITFTMCVASVIFFVLLCKLKKKNCEIFLKVAIFLIFLYSIIYMTKYIDVISTDEIYSQRIPEELSAFFGQDKNPFRVLDLSRTLTPAVSMIYGIDTITGYDAIQLDSYRNYMSSFLNIERDLEKMPYLGPSAINETYIFSGKSTDKISDTLGLMNVKYIITKFKYDDSPYFELREEITVPVFDGYVKTSEERTVYVYENIRFMPRIFAVTSRVLENGTATYYVKNGNITHYSPNEIQISIDLDWSGTLVLSDNYYPGWEVYVNSEKREVLQVYQIMKGVDLDAGKSEVIFTYNPISVTIGRYVTQLTALFIIVAFLLKYLR